MRWRIVRVAESRGKIGINQLTDLHRQHRYRSSIDAFNRKSDDFAFLPAGKYVQHRKVVIGRWD